MATKKKNDPLDLIGRKLPTVVSLKLCMDSEAFSALGIAKQDLDEAEAKLAGLKARASAIEGSGIGGALDVQIAEAEAELDAVSISDASERARLSARLTALRARELTGHVARVNRDMSEAEAELVPLQKAYDVAKKKADEATVEFKCRALPHKVVRKLMAEHPPTEEQSDSWAEEMARQEVAQAVIDKGLQYNVDTYPPAFIAKALVSPRMTEEQVTEMIWASDSWNETEKTSLLELAMVAQQSVPLAR